MRNTNRLVGWVFGLSGHPVWVSNLYLIFFFSGNWWGGGGKCSLIVFSKEENWEKEERKSIFYMYRAEAAALGGVWGHLTLGFFSLQKDIIIMKRGHTHQDKAARQPRDV